MPQRVTYHDEQDVENTLKLREVLKTLPGFCRDYFRAMEPTTSTKTRISYAPPGSGGRPDPDPSSVRPEALPGGRGQELPQCPAFSYP